MKYYNELFSGKVFVFFTTWQDKKKKKEKKEGSDADDSGRSVTDVT